MVSLDDLKALARPAQTKIVLLVMDGVGGLPRAFHGKTELEAAWNDDGRGASIWDTFVHTSGKIERNEHGDVACDHYNRWESDLDLMSALGLKAYRFSISWPRINPRGTGNTNPAGLDFYDRLVDGLLARGIEPYVTLYHWDLPQALQDQGGWAEEKTVNAFSEYACLVATHLGDRVQNWITLNEPMVATLAGHFLGIHAPGTQNPFVTFKVGMNHRSFTVCS